MSVVISTLTAIALIISCLGLYGLSTYMAEKRFREIGVRKVLGASVQQILLMMTGEFMKLVGIAFVIAVPISLYSMTKWLEGFTYKVSPDISLYALAGYCSPDSHAHHQFRIIPCSFGKSRACLEERVGDVRCRMLDSGFQIDVPFEIFLSIVNNF